MLCTGTTWADAHVAAGPNSTLLGHSTGWVTLKGLAEEVSTEVVVTLALQLEPHAVPTPCTPKGGQQG